MRKTRKQLKGGKFIGKGGYGCSFGYPPLPCWNPRGGLSTRRLSDQISKLMYASEAQQEIVNNRLFRAIDPTQTYFISTTDTDRCRPELGATNPSDQLDKCHLDQTQPLELVFFAYGGIDLDNLTLSAKDYAPFFKSLHNVLEGMTLAHANNIVHHDIKPGNIVTQLLPTGEFQTRLIDYDFAFSLKNITPGDLRHLNSQYVFFPFEALFVDTRTDQYYFPNVTMPTSHLNQIKLQFRQLIRQWYDRFSLDYMKGLVFGNKQPFSDTRQQQIGFTEYYTSYAPTLSVLRTNRPLYLKSVDVYMLGYTLGLILNKFFNCVMMCENKAAGIYKIAFKVKMGHQYGYLFPEQFTANGFSQEIQNWLQTIQDFILIPYAQLVEEMTTWDLTKRITMADAHLKYGQLLLGIEIFFTEDMITKYLVPMGSIQLQAQPVLPDVPSPTDLTRIQVSAVSPKPNRSYQIPPTNLSKIQTNVFQGGRQKRARKTHKNRVRK